MPRAVPWVLAAALAACGEKPPPEEPWEYGHHAHHPVYGGVLVELGEHEAHVEVVHDAGEGSLTAYIWDGHVEEPIFISMDSIEVSLGAGGQVTLRPVTDPKTGDRPGRASKFTGNADALRGLEGFRGTIRKLVVAGGTYEAVAVEGEE